MFIVIIFNLYHPDSNYWYVCLCDQSILITICSVSNFLITSVINDRLYYPDWKINKSVLDI